MQLCTRHFVFNDKTNYIGDDKYSNILFPNGSNRLILDSTERFLINVPESSVDCIIINVPLTDKLLNMSQGEVNAFYDKFYDLKKYLLPAGAIVIFFEKYHVMLEMFRTGDWYLLRDMKKSELGKFVGNSINKICHKDGVVLELYSENPLAPLICNRLNRRWICVTDVKDKIYPTIESLITSTNQRVLKTMRFPNFSHEYFIDYGFNGKFPLPNIH